MIKVKEKKSFETKNPRKLKNSGKPKGHAINALNQHAPRATLCVALPPCIKFGAEPQELQTA